MTIMQKIKAFADRLEELYAAGQRPPENLELMNKFMRRNKHTGLRPATLAIDYEVLQIFSVWCRKSISTLDEDDIFDFLDYLDEHTYERRGKIYKYSKSSKTTFKRILNKFFTTSGFPELGKVFKEKGGRTLEPKDRKDLLTKSEIEKLIATAQLPRDKAIIATLYESGCRRGELLSCRVGDVNFNENGCKLTFPDGKTGKRTVQLVYASSYLRNWIENHPCKLSNGETDPETPLWTGMYRNKEGSFHGLTDQAVFIQLKKIGAKAGITKRVNPHSFRHARASDLAEHLTEQQLKQYLGWTQSSNMCAVYVHDPNTDNAILKMNGIQIEDTHTDGLRVSKCPRCKTINPEKAKYCLTCGLPLTTEIATNTEKDKSDIQKEFLLNAFSDPEIQAMIKKLSN
jgi:site-specific recombinase XerD/phage FluMu protein Com